jgi:hypothetical protein
MADRDGLVHVYAWDSQTDRHFLLFSQPAGDLVLDDVLRIVNTPRPHGAAAVWVGLEKRDRIDAPSGRAIYSAWSVLPAGIFVPVHISDLHAQAHAQARRGGAG